ncbi:hypothetical protein KI688_012204 [Linnemannia hyalina]|uniref:Uncharacterized protein n=1 Tax=Linnemannia hyalina TaxID=64524 RepID=A0A9P8BTT5_9FUNG|nr:hypothetical protein KI688_012204 [Linnemannia hyalina]
MGIPIELPASPAPKSGPCHSAKPSWSRSNGPSVDQSAWIQQARADVAAASVSASLSTTAAAVDEAEIQSPSPARAARPPNLRRISRVPVFVTSPSGSGSESGSGSGSTGTVNTLSVRPAPVASPTTSTFNSDYYSTTQEQQEQPHLPQERASWNYRFVNMNHADNYNRPETNTLSGSGMMHGYYYEDDRLRHDHSPIMRSYHQQHYQSAESLSTGGTAAATTMAGTTGPADSSANANVTVFSSSPTSVLTPRPRQYYSMRGGSEVIDDSDDIDEEWILQQQQQQNQQQQHLSERSPSSSSSSSSSTTLMTSVPSFLQGHPMVARTVIRADAFHQGVIHIYPENHAPIRMSQGVALSAEGEEDAGKEGFDEASVSESHHHQHHRADHGAPLLNGEQEQDQQQDQ